MKPRAQMFKLTSITLLVAFVLVGCPGPAQYATQLAACTETSKTWEEYIPCCSAVARSNGRDPSFCLPDRDADTAAIKAILQDAATNPYDAGDQ